MADLTRTEVIKLLSAFPTKEGLGVNLSGADLSGADLSGASLTEAELTQKINNYGGSTSIKITLQK